MKNKRITFRVTEKELKEIKKQAKEKDLILSEFIRLKVL